MRASVFVGRVGGLAVALGIGSGVAVGGVGAAWAAPVDSTSADSAGSGSGATSTRSTSGQPAARQRAARSTRVPEKPAVADPVRVGTSDLIEVPSGTSPRRAVRDSAAQPPDVSASKNQNETAAETVVPASSAPSQDLSDQPVALPTAAESAATVALPPSTTASTAAPVLTAPMAEQPETTLAPPVMVPTPQPSAAAPGVVESVLAPLSGTGPVAPVEAAVSWVMLAAARRELGSPAAAQNAPARAVPTEPLPDNDAVSNRTAERSVIPASAAASEAVQIVDPVASATATNPIAAIFEQIGAFVTQIVTAITQVITQVVTAITNIFSPAPANKVPVAAAPPTVGTPDSATGVVAGSVTAADPDGDVLTYSGSTTTAKGAVVVDAATGEFVYTPSAAARHAAASVIATDAQRADTFTVTASDGKGGSTAVIVTVAISPVNAAPVAGTPAVGIPNPRTGVVTGSVSAIDPDADALNYGGSTTTSKGAVVVAADGGFTYTPSVTARQIAAAEDATDTDRTGTFAVTVTDGHGGTTTAMVSVAISPLTPEPVNSAPVAHAPNVGSPNASTGVVIGSVSATDPDGDTVTFSGSTTTAKGAVTVNAASGAFTYTPTAAARHAAARDGAAGADLADVFTVTVADGYGGSVEVPVAVAVAPANEAPVAEIVSISLPDPATGLVTGTMTAGDADGDVITYSVPVSTIKGDITFEPDGTFTYTPTGAARHQAASDQATEADTTDVFTVTFTDGYGGSVAVPVAVNVAPVNSAPVAGSPSVGIPDATTGVVNGSVSATDADGDALTFSGSTTTAKGSVTVSSDGTFTYTPTSSARHTAAGANATQTDKADVFIVSAADGYGGSIQIMVTVPVSPKAIVIVTAAFDRYSYSVTEGDSGITTTPLTVRLSAPSTEEVTVSYRVEGTGLSPAATSNVDFVAETATLVFAPGQTTATLPLKIYGDTLYEDDEYLRVVLTGATGAILSLDGTTSQFLTISNDDTPNAITAAFDRYSYSVTEGDSGITTTPLTVRLSAPSTEEVTVSYRVEGTGLSPAATSNVDFVAETATLVFAPGQTTATLPLKIYGDTLYEDDEYLRVVLTGATGAILSLDGTTSQFLTISNDDTPNAITAAFDRYSYSVTEGDSGITTTPLTVRLSAPSTEEVTVSYRVEGTGLSPAATSNVDFVAETATLVFAPGQTTATLPLKIYGDTLYEDDEYLRVVLTGATGAILSLDGTTSQFLTISNDDTPSPAATLSTPSPAATLTRTV